MDPITGRRNLKMGRRAGAGCGGPGPRRARRSGCLTLPAKAVSCERCSAARMCPWTTLSTKVKSTKFSPFLRAQRDGFTGLEALSHTLSGAPARAPGTAPESQRPKDCYLPGQCQPPAHLDIDNLKMCRRPGLLEALGAMGCSRARQWVRKRGALPAHPGNSP